MKKFGVLFYVLTVSLLVLVCTQCKKEPVCELMLRVHTTTDGTDTADALPNAFVRIGLEDNYADFAKAEGYTDANGVFTHTFAHEALLDVVVTCDTTIYEYVQVSDTQVDTIPHFYSYYGTGRVKLIPDETVEEYIIMTTSN